jgi:hypothetical protein
MIGAATRRFHENAFFASRADANAQQPFNRRATTLTDRPC